MKILNLFLVFVLAAQTHFVFARSQGNANMYDATDTSYRAAADAQQRELMTIREAAIQAQAAANKGKSMANAAVGVTAAGVAATCWTSFFGGASLCKYFVGGLAASVAVRLLMSNAGGTSGSTIGAVTTTDDPYNLGHGPNNTSQKPDYAEEPEYKDAQKVLTKLKNEGWKIDLKSGMITPQKEKPILLRSHLHRPQCELQAPRKLTSKLTKMRCRKFQLLLLQKLLTLAQSIRVKMLERVFRQSP